MLKRGQWFQKICFKQEKTVNIKEKFTESKKADKQMTIEREGTSSSTVGGSAGSSSSMSNNTGDDARVPEDNFKIVMVLSLNLKLRFSSFFQGALLQNFKKMVECDLLILEIQQFEDTFSVVSKNLRLWLNILGMGTNDVSAEQRKSRGRKSGG